ncbi:MAG: endonuclease/exonuclease/phosphatase family protein [Planctomycetaceae bacterium]|nr:endonuclease/exonuclease/phosphatase family protein [Planctomycetaceae bacterium]
MSTYTRVGTFNVLNLVSAGVPYYEAGSEYSAEEFSAKTEWIGRQLDRMQADVVGFQEVFHASALQAALNESERLRGITPIIVGTDDTESPAMHPGVALASRLPAELMATITRFPDAVRFDDAILQVNIDSFSRPVLKAKVEVFPGIEATVFVAHLKSKRPTYLPEESSGNPVHRALGTTRALVRRAAEAAALRVLVVHEMQGNQRPVIVLGDLNDGDRAVTTQMIAGDPPFYKMSRNSKEPIWDVLLYSAQEIQLRQSTSDVYYTHIYNSFHEALDHILVSEEFYARNPDRIAELDYVHVFNDHLIDEAQTFEEMPRTQSDHGQVVARLRLRE